LSDAWTLRLQGDLRTRAYEDYSNLDLSNLDYDQFFGHARLRFRPSRSHDVQIGTSIGKRVYDDRRARALDTGFLEGTDLEFDFLNLEASWKFEINRQHDLRLAFNYNRRADNATGYYDTSLDRMGLRYRYRPDWSNRFSAQLEYRDFDYENIPAELIINDEENVAPSNGTRLTLSYDRRLVRNDERTIWLETLLSYDDFDSPNQNYIYDRTVARIGLVVDF
jgi:hypothetical protein